MRGRLIAFEGGEACGKSTQARLLAEAMGAVLTREPGGTPLGAKVRALLLDHDASTLDLDPRAEALLLAADRADHVARVIAPALAAGRDVVTDRFVGSSLAYQGHGRGLDVEEVARLSAWATGGVEADLVVLLDVPDAVAAARRNRDLDRLESAGAEFHRRVIEGFRSLAAADERWHVVDGVGTIEAVGARVREVVERWRS